MSSFVHLHVHSHYSLLNALPKIKDLVKRAKKHGMSALALTDNGNLYGAIEFYQECRAAGLKPIIGVDAYMAARTRFDKQSGVDTMRSRVIFLARTVEGYKNLIEMVTSSFLEGFYYKPRIDRELVEKYAGGLVCISPSFSGEISLALKNKDKAKALELLEWYKNLFKDDFYIEITRHPEIQGHEEKMKELIAFARETKTPIMAAHDVYYLDPEDHEARETMIAIQNGGDRRERADFENAENFSFIGPADAEKLFSDLPDALENTAKIALGCDADIPLGKWTFPAIDIPDGKTADEAFRDIVSAGLKQRKLKRTKEVLDRVEYELGVIKTKGYSKYFLVVADLLQFARENGILSNIRGSVSGSIVTYLAGITNIDPLEYEIPFERFLNPDRPSAPDIDMDYADNRRDEMVEYTRRKYGYDKVAQIGTFGTMMARGSVRDVARALGYPYSLGDKIAKLIPMGSQGFPMTIDRALDMEDELKTLYGNDSDVKRIIDMAKKIEGCARHIGIHAAGIVIAPTKLTDYTPLQYDPKGENKIITQYDMYSVDENGAGLLKFDFLGLKNLSIIAEAIGLIERIENKKIDIDTIPIDDKKTFEMLARGETANLFQLNGSGMTKFLVDLKPSTIHDINAMVALYRPGPMDFIPEFIARKHGHVPIEYLDPALEPILKKTYGILVYQDDLLMMANKLAGYSWGEVDKFRKAVGKKIPEEMAKQKDKFIQGCIEHSGWSEKKAKQVWAWIEPFAAYGFNKAHSVSYGRIAYITAYLKANFPGEYMTAVLTAEAGDIEKVSETVAECKRMGIEVLPPDVNESYREFTLIKTGKETGLDSKNSAAQRIGLKNKIRFGLGSVKNFGEGVAQAIIDERRRLSAQAGGGKFTSLIDFLDRVRDKNLNKKSLESLVKCGALDAFGERGELLFNLENIVAYNKENHNAIEGQASLFGLMTDRSTIPTLRLEQAPEANFVDKLAWEKELLGLYVSGHPLDRFENKLAGRKMDIEKTKSLADGRDAIVAGIIEECREIYTKKGEKMAFIRIADFSGAIEAVVFPDTYANNHEIFRPETCIVVKGKMSRRNDSPSIVVNKAKVLS